MTDTIEAFTEDGHSPVARVSISMPDIIVTATGLNAKLFCGLDLYVDGERVDLAEDRTAYKGMMYSDVPNLASAVGYTNASWTLKCDLIAEHVVRILNHMRDRGFDSVTPRVRDVDGHRAAHRPPLRIRAARGPHAS